MKNQLVFVTILVVSCLVHAQEKKYACVKYPVVDLYNSPDCAGGKTLPAMAKHSTPCPRINQALFNEKFEIIQYGQHMSSIAIPWAVYGYDATGRVLNNYWIETKNFFLVNDSPKYDNLLATLPHYAPKEALIILKRPFTDPGGITYSVGTEFVCAKKQPHPHAYTVERFTSATNSIETLVIPKKSVYRQKKLTPDKARKEFVKLLSEFVQEIDQQKTYNTIPYVWGGNSFTKAYTSEFTQDDAGFHRAEQETLPLSGYDCSMLVARFAHMVGIPYFFKTTAMLEKYGKKFLPTDKLEEGDLIWFQGHVVVVTDLKNNLVTESCGYENFVGKVRTTELCKLIKNINTWDDLINAYIHKHRVIRLDANGNDFKESPIKIFKLF